VDPEFQRILFRVLLIGGVIGLIGFAGVYLAFRSFGQLSEKRAPRPIVFVLVAFIIASCLVLLRFAVAR
jgi:hypothetical protein